MQGRFALSGRSWRTSFQAAGGDRLAADVEDGALRGVDHFGGGFGLFGVAEHARLVAGEIRGVVDFGVHLGGGDIHGEIDQHGAGAAGGGDEEGFVDDAREVVDALDEVGALGDGADDAGHVSFLEGIIADHVGAHLAAEDDHGDRIHVGGGERRDGIGCAGAGGDDHDTGLAGGAGVSVGHVSCALFVADEDEVNFGVIEGVEGGQNRAAGIAEGVGDAVLSEHLDEDLRAGLADVAVGEARGRAHDGQAVGIHLFLHDLEFRDLVGARTAGYFMVVAGGGG